MSTHQSTEQSTQQTAIVTGASRGFGRAIATALVARGDRVIGIARDGSGLAAVQAELGAAFTPVVGDATGEQLAEQLIRTHRPTLLVLNAGAVPHVAPVQEQSWESFSHSWEVDTRHAFAWIRAALREPLAPGSTVVAMSSGAALNGSPLSGGYASAKAGVRHLSGYGADESQRAGLGIRFTALFPPLTPAGAVGAAGVAGYARRQGVDREAFVAAMPAVLTAEQVARAVLEAAQDRDGAAEYRITADGATPLD
ncbi:SDR family oxidoreductase [Kitasatospora sp. NPDC006697]|uniref:SDR family oxidoreductase n=1 Tax=Kitasatospora sp. NPDC006697 TaxID=3364020 RepID=UPI003676CDFD